MKSYGVARLGRDAEVRFVKSGDSVCTLSLAFTFGKKDESGKKPVQWVEAALWGKRAEVLSPYLKKGNLIFVTLDDIHIAEYGSKEGKKVKLNGKVIDIELIPTQKATDQKSSDIDSFNKANHTKEFSDDDIPF